MRAIFLIIVMTVLIACGSDPVATEPPTTGVIEGVVSDAATYQVVGFVKITTRPPTASVTTDTLGNYKIKNVDPGTYVVVGNKLGYDSTKVSVTVSAGNTTTADLSLLADSTVTF